jgi:tetratricopeptide (TPR) repeat protein
MSIESTAYPPENPAPTFQPDAEQTALRRLIADLENQPDAPDDLASALNDLGDAFAAQGRCDAEVLALYRRALQLFIDAGGEDQPDVANVLNNLASVHYERGEYQDAEQLSARALAIMDALFAQDDLVAAADPDSLDACRRIQRGALSLYASARRAQGDYAGAEAPLRRALSMVEEHFGADSEDMARSLNDLGMLYKYWGRFAEAEPLYLRARAILAARHGENAPELAYVFYNLGGLNHALGNYAAAEIWCRQSLALQERIHGEGHPQLAVTHGTLAAILDGLGRYDEAEELYRRALAGHVARHGTEHPEVALNLSNLAALAETRGRLAEAEALYLHALHIRERCLGPNHPQVATCLNNLGMLAPRIGEGAQAESLFRRALDILERSVGADHPHTRICREHWEKARGNNAS